MGLLDRFRPRASAPQGGGDPAALAPPPLIYSWVITGRLAIGPLPRSKAHWQQLQDAGFRSRFSCCYPHEEVVAPPEDWLQGGVSLPDHRRQEPLRPERVALALEKAGQIIRSQPATYLHCMAGMERSPLIAVGLLARERNLDVLEALEAIRLCHPRATPIYSDLDLLEQVLKG
jgi:hypothetical protein